VQREGYVVTAEFEAGHWWFLSRRDLFMRQVGLAANQIESTRLNRSDRLEILDYGCGTGFNLQFLAQFGRVTGADVAPESLDEFQKTVSETIVDLTKDTSGLRGSFDIVTALDVLEHFDDDVAGLRQIRDLLKPGGQLIVTVPAYEWLWGGEDEISLHRRRYTRSLLKDRCRAARFSVLFLSYFNLSILPLMTATIWTKRVVMGKRALQVSNLQPTQDWVNRLLYRVTAWENRRVGNEAMTLPAGASLVCRMQRMPDEATS
jgi:2-polyprenyl-3-methyl-5-hydroxy-6-metoxy-1,4-benzoquinol methylase